MSHSRSEKNTGKRSRPQEPNANPAAQSSSLADADLPVANQRASVPAAETRYDPTHNEIATWAYRCWHERGCPEGSPEVDWSRAEEELRIQRQGKAASAAS